MAAFDIIALLLGISILYCAMICIVRCAMMVSGSSYKVCMVLRGGEKFSLQNACVMLEAKFSVSSERASELNERLTLHRVARESGGACLGVVPAAEEREEAKLEHLHTRYMLCTRCNEVVVRFMTSYQVYAVYIRS